METIEALDRFIKVAQDAREVKRAIVVKLLKQGHKLKETSQLLNVSLGFGSKWKRIFDQDGVEGLKLGYKGSQGYLMPEQREAVIEWLKSKNHWELAKLQTHLRGQYQVVYKSRQSYYDLFQAAGISWKKKPENQSPQRP